MTSAIDLGPFADFLSGTSLEVWIASNAREGVWHLGVRREARGARTGKVYAVSYVTRCSGRQLGGAYGQTRHNGRPAEDLCPRCVALLGA